MRRARPTVLLLLTVLGLACEDRQAGPPALLVLEKVTEFSDQTALLRARVEDQMQRGTRAGGELTWEFVESTGAKHHPRCKLTTSLGDGDFKETEEEGLFFEVKFILDKPCKPLASPDSFAYGLISLRLSDGRVIRDDKFAWTPRAYGGSGQMEFPDQEAAVRRARTKHERKNAAIEKLFSDLGRAAGARPDPELAPGAPCPSGLAARGTVLRVDHRVLAALSRAYQNRAKVKLPLPVGTPGFEATNDSHVDDLVNYQNGDRKRLDAVARLAGQPRSHLLLVDVEKILEPKAYTSKKFDSGFFSGEVWVVDIAAAKVLCRAKASAMNSESFKATDAEVYTRANLDFIGQVSRALHTAREKVAPGLVPAPEK